jgi:hypothetical protein
MNVLKIIESGLKANGFDGLVNPGTCGCIIGDISPGGCLHDHCHAAYKHTHSQTGEWITSVRKDGVIDDEIQQCIDECS